MKFDFTTVYDRRGKDSIAVDDLGYAYAPKKPKEGFDPIPMWVADMSFGVAPSVQEALMQRIQHPIYGYFGAPAEYYNRIIHWHQKHNGVTNLKRENIGYENGVLGGVVSALNLFCSRGDKVLLQAPAYTGFINSLENNGYGIVYSHLVQDEQGIWRMDFTDIEKKIVENKIHAAVLCSPHNPCGRVWERWELEQLMELYRKYDVMVVSDEIWSDLVLEGYHHIPTQSVSDDARMRTIAMYAPSKTFNLAGLVASYHIIYNPILMDRHQKVSSLSRYNTMNVLSMHALMGAYSDEGNEWLQELRHVLTENVEFACQYIQEHFHGVQVSRPQGTYMLFLDCEQWCNEHGMTMDDLIHVGWDVGVEWQDGRPFQGKNHIRMNVSLPKSRLQEALDRLDRYVFCDKKEK